MKKLTVFGCSFGDYMNGGLKHVYGDLLATKLGLDYQHESKGAGSNRRIWRRFWELDQQGSLDNNLIIIQYTEPTRTEFFTPRPPFASFGQEADKNNPPTYEEPMLDGSILRYKFGASEWQNTLIDKEFFSLYENNYVSSEFSDLDFKWQNFQFQHALRSRNHRVIFLKTRLLYSFKIIEPFEDWSFHEPVTLLNDEKYRYEENDFCHLNHTGHELLSNLLYDHIHKLGWFKT